MASVVAEDYISYVDSVTHKMCKSFGCLNDYDDLRSCGYLGLLEAINRYDDSKNVTFKQFAYIRISGAVIDGMRSLYAGSKKSVTFKRKLEELTSKLGEANSDTLASELGMTLDEFHKNKGDLNKMCRANFSDLCQVSESDFSEIFSEFTAISPEADSNVVINEIWDYIKKNYSSRDYLIMQMIYKREMTMLDAGKVVGLTECRVSQIHYKIINEIKRKLFKLTDNKNVRSKQVKSYA